MPGLIGKKIGMTSVFDPETRRSIACTMIEVGPCYVTQVKTQKTDGYNAVQIGYDECNEKNVTKPLQGHLDKAGAPPVRVFCEFDFDVNAYKPGDKIEADYFTVDDFVDVTGAAKGRGFQGVIKRHGFSGVGGETHGQHNRQRAPGSLGACSFPARVFKGKRLPGQMGNNRVLIKNLRVLNVYKEQNVILVSGAVPGARGSYVYITK